MRPSAFFQLCASPFDFNPRTHRGVRQKNRSRPLIQHLISIHAPIVGCDSVMSVFNANKQYFNPRTHRGVRLRLLNWIIMIYTIFQSTHPSWGATLYDRYHYRYSKFQSTHPSWGATLFGLICSFDFLEAFQSTHPSWGATVKRAMHTNEVTISIHAPIVGCDWNTATLYQDEMGRFQSTHPSWGATINVT